MSAYNERIKLQSRARHKALQRLAELHSEEFAAILLEEKLALGIKPHKPKSERIAALEAKIAALRGQS